MWVKIMQILTVAQSVNQQFCTWVFLSVSPLNKAQTYKHTAGLSYLGR